MTHLGAPEPAKLECSISLDMTVKTIGDLILLGRLLETGGFDPWTKLEEQHDIDIVVGVESFELAKGPFLTAKLA